MDIAGDAHFEGTFYIKVSEIKTEVVQFSKTILKKSCEKWIKPWLRYFQEFLLELNKALS